jgi:hypothetical protein
MENQKIEYKKSFGKEVIISLAAFANLERKIKNEKTIAK